MQSNVPRKASETPNLAGLVRFQGAVPISRGSSVNRCGTVKQSLMVPA
jgi:hypothetical protein